MSRIRYALLFVVAVLSLPTAEARQLRLVKSQRRNIPGEAAHVARLLQSYTRAG